MPSKKAPNLNWYQRFTYTVVNFTEYIFYNLGRKVGHSPKKTILFCWIFVLLSSLGFLRFHQEKNPMKLWVPRNSKFVKDTEWLMEKFQLGYRPQVVQIVANDVLTPEILQQLLELDFKIDNTITAKNVTWSDVCFTIPKVNKELLRLMEGDKKSNVTEKDPSVTMNAALYCSFIEIMENECFKKSILELWDYNPTVINQLTKTDILNTINDYDENAIMGRFKNYKELLGGVIYNETGHIVAAKSLQNFWMVSVNFTTVDMDKTGNNAGTADWASEDALEWESEFLKTIQNFKYENNLTFFYTASRSFGDISNATMFQDIGILCIGIFIMVIYVQFVISKFNWLEARVTLGCIGLLTVGMAFIVGCGLCSLIGVSYGPVHTSLPFLLMGLGIDDMFVIMACWEELTKEQKKLPVPERIGLMLKHAGVSITVTSVTDILAFIIGASTILPSLESYCIYAAFCVFMTFIFAVTFFTACFVLDQERIEKKHNGIIVCLKHENYEVNECSQRQISNKVFQYVYSKAVLTPTGKTVVILITVICLGFSLESIRRLEQKFDPTWFIPKSTYFADYLTARKTYFPTSGFEAGIYMGAVNYSTELFNIKKMVDELSNNSDIALGVISWVDPFRNFVKDNFHTDIYEEVLSDTYFSLYLSMFLFSARNAVYQANFRFERPLECGVGAPNIIMSSIEFHFNQFRGPEEYLPAMHAVQDIAARSNFSTGDKFITVWSKVFATWITDELIETEVVRNLQLALLCVMICTALLIADLQACFWIFICVLLTMVNVCGFMQRWGLTIDLVSCIGLELAIGLCVDYATHIGHTFLTIKEGTRRERSLKTVTSIGSAVVYGGISTLIGVFMLSQSEAYTFQSFFKIFFLVIVFGLFHGVVLLPVILSWVGPKPYNVGTIVSETEMI
ncbi:protein patched homolog 1-like isoform X1 [Tribolium madens]|uniref:protein patched homolog 1-like isoform X1 n=2 Tax=Tribolium madens TaxID=41895 RepID=UPI001CF71D9F|nr:protein patched homolog 1-like isoform X1 [Tribolium madens]